MLLFKTLRFLWPFLKEMILGDKTLKEALKTNFWRVLLIVGIIVSIALNFFTIPRLLEISYAHVELKRKHSLLIKQCWPNSDPGNLLPEPVAPAPPATAPPKAPATPAAPALPAPPIPREDAVRAYDHTREFFEKLKKQEH